MHHETLSPSSRKTFYLDGEYWRSSLYVVIGAVILGVVSHFMMQLQGRGVADRVTSIAVMCVLFVFGLSLLPPRLHINGDGIHRRLFFWYWDSWLWEDFRSGAIREGMYLHSYRAPARRFWCRSLALDYYPDEAREAIGRILEKFQIKPQIEIPEFISFTLFSEQWEFREEGITLQKRRNTRSYHWEDIEIVSVTKLTHEHQNFRNLDVKFTDKTLTLRVTSHQGQRIENWKGAQEEEILAFLMKQLPEVRIEVTAREGIPRTVAEANRRLDKIDKQIRELKKIRKVLTFLIACLPIIGIIDQKIGMILYSMSMAVLLYAITNWMLKDFIRRFESQRAEINDWLRSEDHSDCQISME